MLDLTFLIAYFTLITPLNLQYIDFKHNFAFAHLRVKKIMILTHVHCICQKTNNLTNHTLTIHMLLFFLFFFVFVFFALTGKLF